MFSKACEYGIRAAIYIAGQSEAGKRAGLREIAAEIDSPEAFTAKILQNLVRAGVISSSKGPNGGFEVSSLGMKTIVLADIVSAIDGDSVFTGCGLGLKECSVIHPCPVHHKFKVVRDELRKMLESTSLKELSMQQTSGMSFLKR